MNFYKVLNALIHGYGYVKTYVIWMIGALFSYIMPIKSLMVALCLICVLDLLLALSKVYVEQGRQGIEPRKVRKTLFKILSYLVFILILHYIDMYLLQALYDNAVAPLFDLDGLVLQMKIAHIAGFVMLLQELLSIDKHWEGLFGYGLVDAVKNIYNKATSVVKILKTKKEKDDNK